MNARRKKKVKSRGQETTRPHTVSTHICEPQLILHQQKKNNNPGTHTFIWIRSDRQTHTVHSIIGRQGLKRKAEQQRTGRGKPQTRGGETMGSGELSLERRDYRSAVGETASTLFSYRQTKLENPTLTTGSPVHLDTRNRLFSAKDRNSSPFG